MKKLFTLVELLIGIVIIWILSIILFRTYIELSNISIRIENEKIVSNELLYVSQLLQNLSDNYKIDLNKYTNLKEDLWINKILYLSWNWENISLYLTWECAPKINNFWNSQCFIQMNKDWNIIDVTNKNSIYVEKLFFRIIPYWSNENYDLNFDEIYQNWFWINSSIYIKKYNPNDYKFNVKYDFQTFYNIRIY